MRSGAASPGASSVVLLAVVLLAAAAFVAPPSTAWAKPPAVPTVSPNDPSSGDLVEDWETFDGAQVSFTGEAIGERMVRGENAWIHVNDDAYYERNIEEGASLGGYNSGHAVWLPASEAGKIGVFGDYGHEGDVVTVRGTFNAACAQHGGDMDIHAASLVVDVPGREVVDRVKVEKVAAAGILGLLAVGLYLTHRSLNARLYRR